MRTIYSTERVAVQGARVLGIGSLPEAKRRWIAANRERLLRTPTLPERIAARTFARFEEKPVRQAYFMIRGRSYFLDFFFPEMMVAVEIDGSVHRLTKQHDKRRDADFRSIGIRTVRIRNSDVMEGRLYDKLYKRLCK